MSHSQWPSSRAGHRQRVALLRDLQRAARRIGARQLAQRQPQQRGGQRAQGQRAQRGGQRLRAPRCQCGAGVTRHGHHQRVVGHRLQRDEVVGAVHRAGQPRHRRGGRPVRRQQAVEHVQALAQHALGRRVAREQPALAMRQRDARGRVGVAVAVEVLEVLDAPRRADHAGEAAGAILETTADGEDALLRAGAGAHVLDRQPGALPGAQPVERRLRGDAQRRHRRRRHLRHRAHLAVGPEHDQAVGLHQPFSFGLQVAVQRVGVGQRQRAALQLLRQVRQHHVDGLDAARGLLGDDARLRREFAFGAAHRVDMAAPDVVTGLGRHHGDEGAAQPGQPARRPAAGQVVRRCGRMGVWSGLHGGGATVAPVRGRCIACARARRFNCNDRAPDVE